MFAIAEQLGLEDVVRPLRERLAEEQQAEAINDVYARTGKSAPGWLDDDSSDGWPPPDAIRWGTPTLTRHGADPADPEVVKIALVKDTGEERVTDYMAPGELDETIFGEIEDMLGRLNKGNFVAVRVYRGTELVHDEAFEHRN